MICRSTVQMYFSSKPGFGSESGYEIKVKAGSESGSEIIIIIIISDPQHKTRLSEIYGPRYQNLLQKKHI
jgi:hypothetical protein